MSNSFTEWAKDKITTHEGGYGEDFMNWHPALTFTDYYRDTYTDDNINSDLIVSIIQYIISEAQNGGDIDHMVESIFGESISMEDVESFENVIKHYVNKEWISYGDD